MKIRITRKFSKSECVRHRKSDRTGVVIGVSPRGYLTIDWDDSDFHDCRRWPPTSFSLLTEADL